MPISRPTKQEKMPYIEIIRLNLFQSVSNCKPTCWFGEGCCATGIKSHSLPTPSLFRTQNPCGNIQCMQSINSIVLVDIKPYVAGGILMQISCLFYCSSPSQQQKIACSTRTVFGKWSSQKCRNIESNTNESEKKVIRNTNRINSKNKFHFDQCIYKTDHDSFVNSNGLNRIS